MDYRRKGVCNMTQKDKKIYVFDSVKTAVKTDPAAAVLLFVLRFILAVIPTLQTLVTAAFVDEVTGWSAGEGHVGTEYERSVLLLVILLVSFVAYSWISKSLTVLLEQHLEMRLRARMKPRLVEKITRLKYESMENSDMRDKISRVNKDTEIRICGAYSNLLYTMELILKAGGILVIMFTQVWWLAVLIFAVSVPCFRIAMKSGKEGYEAEISVTKQSRIADYYNEMLVNREYVDERTLFQYQEEYIKRFAEKYEETRKYKTKVRLEWFVKMKAGSMATIFVSIVFMIIMIPLTLNGRLTLGLFMSLTNAVFGIVQNMSWDLTRCIDLNTWYNEYFREMEEVFHLEEDEAEGGKTKTETTAEEAEQTSADFRSLEFCDVTFRYPGTDRDILKHLSFRIKAGKKYAFVGANGAGKTTIIKLLNGLYSGYSGKILVNGEDIRSSGRNFISNVFQDYARYPVSLRDNMTLGRKDAVAEEELQKTVDDIGLRQTVEKLEHGVDTVLGKAKENSQDLSGGEWQKTAMARCALSKAPVRILDEPTSAMDPVYETTVYQKFQQMSRGKTVLLVSHRLASVKMSDIIFVLDGGSVAEAGTHTELMEKDGLYRRMYEEQAKWYEEDWCRRSWNEEKWYEEGKVNAVYEP